MNLQGERRIDNCIPIEMVFTGTCRGCDAQDIDVYGMPSASSCVAAFRILGNNFNHNDVVVCCFVLFHRFLSIVMVEKKSCRINNTDAFAAP